MRIADTPLFTEALQGIRVWRMVADPSGSGQLLMAIGLNYVWPPGTPADRHALAVWSDDHAEKVGYVPHRQKRFRNPDELAAVERALPASGAGSSRRAAGD